MGEINNMAIPYWILVFVTIIDILSIIFDNSIVSPKDIRHRLARIRLSVIPKSIFVIIYIWFAIDNTIPLEVKALHGRNVLFIMMLFDFFIHSANIADSNQETIKKYFIKITSKVRNMKLIKIRSRNNNEKI